MNKKILNIFFSYLP